MPQRAAFCYAWDLAEAGVEAVADELRALQINDITLACAYHAGKFLRPHGVQGKVYFPEDGTAYFKTSGSRYGEIKPRENSLLDRRDLLRECCDLDGLSVTAWLVLMHNSRLGARHPAHCVSNAFGDRLIYNLCPASPAAREYAIALCRDVTEHYPVAGVTLETPGFLPYAHGFHHEFAMLRANAWLDNLLGLCFCAHCMAGAGRAGIDAEGLRARVAASVEAYLGGEVDHEADMAQAFWHAQVATDPDLGALLNWRCSVVETLVGEIRSALRADASVSVIPSVARPSSGAWYEGSNLARLAPLADYLQVCLYEPSAGRILSDVFDVTQRIGGTRKLRVVLRPGYPDVAAREEFVGVVAALHGLGVRDFAFYNYGHLRRPNLEWIGAALGALDGR